MQEGLKETSVAYRPPCPCLPRRWILSVTAMGGFAFVYAMRINMSIAIVCMVIPPNDTAVGATGTPGTGSCGPAGTDQQPDYPGEFEWDKSLQGHVLNAYFYGYLVTQVLGGWLAARHGGKWVYSVGMSVSIVATLLIPVGARLHVGVLIFLRVLIGAASGVTYPAHNAIMAKWAPPSERSKLLSVANSGSNIGNVLTLAFSGMLCATGIDGGWPLVFYIFGGATALWLLGYVFLVHSSPAEHPRISPEERSYIQDSLGNQPEQILRIPWLSIMTSRPVWAMIIAHTCSNWGGYTLLTSLPMYMSEVLHYDIKQNGLLSSMPYIVQFVTSVLGGQVADLLRQKGCLSTTATRKTFQLIGFAGSATFLVATGFVECEQRYLAVIFLALATGFTFGSISGCICTSIDIAPRFASILFGISNTTATIPGIVAPLVVGQLTPNGRREEWQTVFYICAGIYAVGGLVYLLLASGELQPWATVGSSARSSLSARDTPRDTPPDRRKGSENQSESFGNVNPAFEPPMDVSMTRL